MRWPHIKGELISNWKSVFVTEEVATLPVALEKSLWSSVSAFDFELLGRGFDSRWRLEYYSVGHRCLHIHPTTALIWLKCKTAKSSIIYLLNSEHNTWKYSHWKSFCLIDAYVSWTDNIKRNLKVFITGYSDCCDDVVIASCWFRSEHCSCLYNVRFSNVIISL